MQSVGSILRLHLGQVSLPQTLDTARAVVATCPDNPLYHKRLAELYEADGDGGRARRAMADALACDPENPFFMFATGRLLERLGATGQGEKQILQAADLDEASAAIQGAAGQIHLRRGNKDQAQHYLKRARDLCPTYKRFSNQLKRTER